MKKNNIKKWNQKIHIYLGLYLLFFIWIFGFSGILLNHRWEFSDSWKNRNQLQYEKVIQLKEHKERASLILEIMDQVKLNGRVINPKYSEDSTQLTFIVANPGARFDVAVNLMDGKVMVKEAIFDSWGIMKGLHKVENSSSTEQSGIYSMAASIWSISVDILSIGLIIICLGGWYMWVQIQGKRFYIGLFFILCSFILSIYIMLL